MKTSSWALSSASSSGVRRGSNVSVASPTSEIMFKGVNMGETTTNLLQHSVECTMILFHYSFISYFYNAVSYSTSSYLTKLQQRDNSNFFQVKEPTKSVGNWPPPSVVPNCCRLQAKLFGLFIICPVGLVRCLYVLFCSVGCFVGFPHRTKKVTQPGHAQIPFKR